MLMIRFQRIGRKNDPAFRMVVLPKTSGPKAGTYVDLVGTYNPKTKAMTVDADKIKGWMAKGAQVSPSLMNLLISKGIIEGTKVQVISKTNLEKNVAKKAEEAAKAAEAAAAASAAAEAAAAAPAAEETVEVSAEEAAPAIEEAAPAPEEEAAPAEAAAEEAPAEEVAA